MILHLGLYYIKDKMLLGLFITFRPPTVDILADAQLEVQR